MSWNDYNPVSGASQYQFWLGELLLPISPGYHKHYYRSSSKTLASIDQGELLIRNDPGLLEYSFTIYLPQSDIGLNIGADALRRLPTKIPVLGSAIEKISYSPSYHLDTLIYYKNSQTPFMYTVIRGIPQKRNLFTTSVLCILDSLTIHEKGENGLLLTIDITLKEYKKYKTKTYSSKSSGSIQTISQNRDATAWYDMENCNSFIGCGVQFLEKQGENAREKGRTLLSNAVSKMNSQATSTISGRLKEPLINGMKIVAWTGIKIAVAQICPLLGCLL